MDDDDEHVSETEFGDENDENAFPARPSPPLRTPLSEPLHDITDQFFHPPSPSPVRHPPRRPRKPKSLAYPADPPNWHRSRASSSVLGTPSSSDPFGFVAVERAIKARTAARSPPRSTILPSAPPPVLAAPIPTNNEDIEGLYADEPVAGPSHIVAPLLMMSSDQPFPEVGPAPDPLRTPRKRRRRVSPTPDPDSWSSDAPSTPSPVKVSAGTRRTPVSRPARVPTTPKRVKTSHQHIPTPSSTPASLGPSTPVPPRRSTRQAVVGARVKGKATVNDDAPRMQLRSRGAKTDAETKTKPATRAKQPKAPTRTKEATATVKPTRGRPKRKSSAKDVKGKGKARPLESVLDLSDDTRQRYEKERRERLEYFKRLEGYQMQKENVYVV